MVSPQKFRRKGPSPFSPASLFSVMGVSFSWKIEANMMPFAFSIVSPPFLDKFS
jgi:hypothetical protein